jgi:class 3 adenylate cyclase
MNEHAPACSCTARSRRASPISLQAGERVADFHEDVGVLFADLSGFTAMSAELPASRVVELLPSILDDADQRAAEHGLCKVKTIGDCYIGWVTCSLA